MFKLKKYLIPFLPFALLSTLLIVAQVMGELSLPSYMADIVNIGLMQNGIENPELIATGTAETQTRYIMLKGLQMLLIALLAGIATIAVGYLTPRIGAGAAKNLRRDIFTKVENFSHHEFDKIPAASLITRCTNDVTQVMMFVTMGLRLLVMTPIMGIGGVIMAVRKSPSMSWIIALAVIILIGLVILIVSIAMPKFKAIQKLIDRLNKISREILSGLMVIRAFNTQPHEIKRFDQANRELTSINLFVGRVMAVIGPAITFIMSGASLLIVWVGAKQIAESNLPIGDMMAFMQYVMQVIMSFMLLSMVFFMLPRAAVSAERIAEVLALPLTITDPSDPIAFDETQKGFVSFENVSFRHHGAEEDALTNISFTAKPGETTAIIGATGSGKSTLANLLLRFYDVSAGKITVGGADIRQVNQGDLRARIGYVPQKGQLLTGTIADNIRYGKPDANENEIGQAAETAQATDFITEKENGFAAEISQGGANVSGGQKQRLSIARALAKKPEILVFDDSFSALDFKTDAKLRNALKTYAADAAMIIIAQRIGTIMNAEQILVLDEGKIVGRGTHEQLLKSCPAYAEIALSQLNDPQDDGAFYTPSNTECNEGADTHG